MHDTHTIAMKMRTDLYRFPEAHHGSMSYTIEEVVADDCYDILKHVGVGWEVLDIGANFGVFSMACVLAGASRVVAVEPCPPTFNALARITRGLVECCCHGMGTGTKMFMRVLDHPVLNQVTASAEGGGAEVYCATMQHMLKQYRLGDAGGVQRKIAIKIDCEGAESSLLALPDDTFALVSELIKYKGRMGMEVHFGKDYCSALPQPVTPEDWAKWCREIPSPLKWEYKVRDSRIGFITIHHP